MFAAVRCIIPKFKKRRAVAIFVLAFLLCILSIFTKDRAQTPDIDQLFTSLQRIEYNTLPQYQYNTKVNQADISTARQTEATSTSQAAKGYLLIIQFTEQLLSDLRNTVELYMINQRFWGLGMIEPYVSQSFFLFLPPIKEDFRSLPLLSTFLNKTNLLEHLHHCLPSNILLETFPDLLINAARKFIVLQMIFYRSIQKENIKECSYPIYELQERLNYHLEKVKDQAVARHGIEYTFTGVLSLCVKAEQGHPFSMKYVAEYVKKWMKDSDTFHTIPWIPKFSVIIPQWRYISNFKPSPYYFDPSFSKANFTDACNLQQVSTTSFVKNYTRNVVNSLSLPKPLIALHVRSERIAISEKYYHREGFVENCFNALSKALTFILLKHNLTKDHVVFLHDGTHYGSHSVDRRIRKSSNNIIQRVSDMGIRNIQYKPVSNSSHKHEQEMAQFVEREMLASTADVLVLVGISKYQTAILEDYLARNSTPEWYHLCAHKDSDNRLPAY